MDKAKASNSQAGYDIIGDIHGFAKTLRNLLNELGYREDGGAFRRPDGRQVVFLGDFIDRGPEVRETLHLVKNMVDAGSAVAVMGNHEFNAICFHTPDGKGGFLRPRTDDKVEHHKKTLEAFAGLDEEWDTWIDWFKQLPFFLDLGGFRAVHATWDPKRISLLKSKSPRDSGFLVASSKKGTAEYDAVETILKGIEVPLPDGETFTDKYDDERSNIRIRWWEKAHGKTYRDIVFPDCETVPATPIDVTSIDMWEDYPSEEPPVFFGHYWLPPERETAPINPNVACLDYSVAEPGGKLVAYRWDGESRLDPSKFLSVMAQQVFEDN